MSISDLAGALCRGSYLGIGIFGWRLDPLVSVHVLVGRQSTAGPAADGSISQAGPVLAYRL